MTWSYAEAEEHILDLERFGMRFGLERMHALLEELGSPQERLEAIHVVGSNGKSSTTRMAAAILQAHGLRVGAYTSPHIGGFNERVQIDGRDVSRESFAAAVERAAGAARIIESGREADDKVTQFEALTAAAFLLLEEAGVEVAVVEAGLGGRLDSTNVLSRSRVQVLTGVSLEHTKVLGESIAEIAAEKVAVVREGATLVVGPAVVAEALEVAEVACAQRGAVLTVAAADPGVELAARGAFQRRNFAVAMAAAEAHLGRLDPVAVAEAAASVVIPGRFEFRAAADGEADLLLDGAHNAEGARELARSVQLEFPGRRVVALVSVLEDKDAEAIVAALAEFCEGIVCTTCSNPRALPSGALARIVRDIGARVADEPEPQSALARARKLAGRRGVVVVTGSLYLLADLGRRSETGRVSQL